MGLGACHDGTRDSPLTTTAGQTRHLPAGYNPAQRLPTRLHRPIHLALRVRDRLHVGLRVRVRVPVAERDRVRLRLRDALVLRDAANV